MQLPRTRFTIRTLMVAVAISGTILGVGIGLVHMRNRSAYYQSRAADSATKETLYANHVRQLETTAADSDRVAGEYSREAKKRSGPERIFLIASRPLFHGSTETAKKNAEKCKRIVEYYSMLKTKYQAAASRPWLSVSPDPPPP